MSTRIWGVPFGEWPWALSDAAAHQEGAAATAAPALPTWDSTRPSLQWWRFADSYAMAGELHAARESNLTQRKVTEQGHIDVLAREREAAAARRAEKNRARATSIKIAAAAPLRSEGGRDEHRDA